MNSSNNYNGKRLTPGIRSPPLCMNNFCLGRRQQQLEGRWAVGCSPRIMHPGLGRSFCHKIADENIQCHQKIEAQGCCWSRCTRWTSLGCPESNKVHLNLRKCFQASRETYLISATINNFCLGRRQQPLEGRWAVGCSPRRSLAHW